MAVQPLSRCQKPTLIGCFALILWSLSALFVIQVSNLPLFEILTCTFGAGFLFIFTKVAYCRQWSRLKVPRELWYTGLLGTGVNSSLFVAAFQHAPAIQIDLLSYLWPIAVMIGLTWQKKSPFQPHHWIAACLGFSAVYLLFAKNTMPFLWQYTTGYLLIMLDVILWAVYVTISHQQGGYHSEYIGFCCGISALFMAAFHFCFEQTIPPTTTQWLLLILMGGSLEGLAYYCWDIGIKRGYFPLLTILSYFSPILSATWLILAKKAPFTWPVVGAFLMISTAGLMSRRQKLN